MGNRRVVLLFNRISENPGEDELDVVCQMNYIRRALRALKYETYAVPFDIHVDRVIEKLKKINPLLAFNLVETVEGTGALLHLSPSILEFLRIPYTGVPLEALLLTTSKEMSKKQMNLFGLPTSDWFDLGQVDYLKNDETYILKPIWEDGSLGLDEENIFKGNDQEFIRKMARLNPKEYFIEHFIDGREFNLSMLGGNNGPEVMPPVEILFDNFPEGKHRILGFNAKWTEDSFEYKNTFRTFWFPEDEFPMLEELKSIALRCWHAFELKGYARIDFRVDKNHKPYILEINGNPGIASYSGYVAAVKEGGLKFTQVIERIIEDALN